MNPTSKHTIRALLGLCACALLLPHSASAAATKADATACYVTLLNDYYDGTINKTYELHCYREAISHLPHDFRAYSNAAEDIQRALQAEIARQNNEQPPPDTTTTTSGQTTPGATTTTTPATTTTTPTTTTDGGPVVAVIQNKGSGGATSFPLPLIILGGLAIFLLAAGAIGLVVRRMQDNDTGTA